MYAEHKDQGLVLIGIHSTRGGEKAADFVKEQGITWPIAVDREGATQAAFAADSFPDYYVIDRQGRVRVADLANGDLDRAIEMLLAEPKPEPAPKKKTPADKPGAKGKP